MLHMLSIYGLDLCSFKYNMKIWQIASKRRKKESPAGNSPPPPPLLLLLLLLPSSLHVRFTSFFIFFFIRLWLLLLSLKAQLAVGHPFVKIMRRCQIAKRTEHRRLWTAEYKCETSEWLKGVSTRGSAEHLFSTLSVTGTCPAPLSLRTAHFHGSLQLTSSVTNPWQPLSKHFTLLSGSSAVYVRGRGAGHGKWFT